MERYACTCGGENPNCFKCDGTGTVSRPAPPPHVPGRPRFVSVETKPAKLDATASVANTATARSASRNKLLPIPERARALLSSKLSCPLCKEQFDRGDELRAHVRFVHAKTDSRAILPTPIKPAGRNGTIAGGEATMNSARALSRCEHCGQMVGDLTKHFQRVHSPSAVAHKEARQSRKALRKAQRANDLKKRHALLQNWTRRLHQARLKYPNAVLCGICGEVCHSADLLREHLHVTHQLDRADSAKRGSGTAQQRGSPQRALDRSGRTDPGRVLDGFDPYEQHQRERRMDATYGMGGTARDHGRFGSAASFDGMDDESDP